MPARRRSCRRPRTRRGRRSRGRGRPARGSRSRSKLADLLEELVVLEGRRSAAADRPLVLVVDDRMALAGRQGDLLLGHDRSPCHRSCLWVEDSPDRPSPPWRSGGRQAPDEPPGHDRPTKRVSALRWSSERRPSRDLSSRATVSAPTRELASHPREHAPGQDLVGGEQPDLRPAEVGDRPDESDPGLVRVLPDHHEAVRPASEEHEVGPGQGRRVHLADRPDDGLDPEGPQVGADLLREPPGRPGPAAIDDRRAHRPGSAGAGPSFG